MLELPRLRSKIVLTSSGERCVRVRVLGGGKRRERHAAKVSGTELGTGRGGSAGKVTAQSAGAVRGGRGSSSKVEDKPVQPRRGSGHTVKAQAISEPLSLLEPRQLVLR